MKKKAIVIFDNAGGVTLQLGGKYAHHYSEPEQAAEDYKLYMKGANTEDWDGHDEELLSFEPDQNSIRNGGYKVYESEEYADIADDIIIEDSWYNEIEFFKQLPVRKYVLQDVLGNVHTVRVGKKFTEKEITHYQIKSNKGLEQYSTIVKR